jgi:hypothetical protein
MGRARCLQPISSSHLRARSAFAEGRGNRWIHRPLVRKTGQPTRRCCSRTASPCLRSLSPHRSRACRSQRRGPGARSIVLVLDDGSGVRRLAPMAARYRELPPDRRAGRRTARQEDRSRRGRPPARRAIWHVLTPNRPFAPAGRPEFLAARRLSLRIGPRERSSHQPDPAAAGDGEISAAPTHDEGTTRPDHAGLDNRPLFMEKLFRFCARRGVGWWYWPCGHQPRPPESKDRRSATMRRRN